MSRPAGYIADLAGDETGLLRGLVNAAMLLRARFHEGTAALRQRTESLITRDRRQELVKIPFAF